MLHVGPVQGIFRLSCQRHGSRCPFRKHGRKRQRVLWMEVSLTEDIQPALGATDMEDNDAVPNLAGLAGDGDSDDDLLEFSVFKVSTLSCVYPPLFSDEINSMTIRVLSIGRRVNERFVEGPLKLPMLTRVLSVEQVCSQSTRSSAPDNAEGGGGGPGTPPTVQGEPTAEEGKEDVEAEAEEKPVLQASDAESDDDVFGDYICPVVKDLVELKWTRWATEWRPCRLLNRGDYATREGLVAPDEGEHSALSLSFVLVSDMLKIVSVQPL